MVSEQRARMRIQCAAKRKTSPKEKVCNRSAMARG